ncbi:hypothetical protein AB0Y20_01245 [Heyndrickxia oleronia]|uniref:hypothetical protein n=1 Tax=Heyndrickxia oleronia TaxID=38875 RepID=UPI003F25D89C
MIEEFKLSHVNGKLFVQIIAGGIKYVEDVTDYFEKDNAHDEWLDYRLGLIRK